jgi:hypothetical protein
VVASFGNPYTFQTAASIGRLFQAQAEEVELEILDLQNDDVLTSCATHENFRNLVDIKVSFLKKCRVQDQILFWFHLPVQIIDFNNERY